MEIFGNNNPLNLEIGIGNGEFIAKYAAEKPDENWIGVEVFKKIFKLIFFMLSTSTRGKEKFNNVL